MQNGRTGRKTLALLLAMLMLFSLLPATALAGDLFEEENSVEEPAEELFFEEPQQEEAQEEIIEEAPAEQQEETVFEEEAPAEEPQPEAAPEAPAEAAAPEAPAETSAETTESEELSMSDSATFEAGEAESATWNGTGEGGLTINVSSSTENNNRVVVSGSVTLNIAEGVTLTVPEGITVPSGATLNIAGPGTLVAGQEGSIALYASGIGCYPGQGTGDYFGTINISGGTVNATGNIAAIGGGNGTVNISGGIVNASGGLNGGILATNTNGTSISISNATVNASGTYYGIKSEGIVSITSGEVTATYTASASGIGAKGFDFDGNKLTIDDGLIVTVGSSYPNTIIGIDTFKTSDAQKTVHIGQPIINGSNDPASPTVYYVSSDVTINERLTINGAVTLHIAQNKTLTAKKGIEVEGENSLTIEADGVGAQAGSLVAMGEYDKLAYKAGIGGSGSVTIKSGTVTAYDGSGAAGISGSTVTINNGTVTATGYSAEGIGGSGSTITINGGNVTASGTTGIGGYNSTTTIKGGTITATGSSVAGIGGSHDASLYANIYINGGTVTASVTGNTGSAMKNHVSLGNNIRVLAGSSSSNKQHVTNDIFGSWPDQYKYVETSVPPVFNKHTIKLGESISVLFGVEFPTGFDKATCKVVFTYNDGRPDSTVVYSDELYFDDPIYYFPAIINPMELADTITAKLYVGDEEISSHTYSAQQYITAQKDNGAIGNLRALLNALQDYGHYMQASGWQDQLNEHTTITQVDSTKSVDVEGARTAVADYTITGTTTGMKNLRIALGLNDQTVIIVAFQLATGYSSVTETNGKQHTVETYSGEQYYQFSSAKLRPTELDESQPFNFTITGNGTVNPSLSIPVMGYVKSMLNNNHISDVQKNAMAAYYWYYKAVTDYNNNPNG